MIINDKFVYIANPRTATSSIQKALGGPDGRENHATFKEIMSMDDYKGQFSFAFIRNPFDYFASHYSWLKPPTFKRQMIKKVNETFAQHYYCMNGDKKVDYLGKFENLEQDFKEICAILGINAPLPHINASPKRKPWQEYYDQELIDHVEKTFEKDFELWKQ